MQVQAEGIDGRAISARVATRLTKRILVRPNLPLGVEQSKQSAPTSCAPAFRGLHGGVEAPLPGIRVGEGPIMAPHYKPVSPTGSAASAEGRRRRPLQGRGVVAPGSGNTFMGVRRCSVGWDYT